MNEQKLTKRVESLIARCQKIMERFAADPDKMPHKTLARFDAMLEECDRLLELRRANQKYQALLKWDAR